VPRSLDSCSLKPQLSETRDGIGFAPRPAEQLDYTLMCQSMRSAAAIAPQIEGVALDFSGVSGAGGVGE